MCRKVVKLTIISVVIEGIIKTARLALVSSLSKQDSETIGHAYDQKET